jgi:hypothetical protein
MPFADVLTEQDIHKACAAENVFFGDGDGDIYTPAVTLWAFLSQCLSASKSCLAAVARVMVLRLALGLPTCSAGTGAYCKARTKFPETLLQRLALQAGSTVEDQAPDDWRWKSRRVFLADGCELSMPDTEANQKEYPQLKSQKKGLGFPRLRLLVLLAFATACLVGGAIGFNGATLLDIGCGIGYLHQRLLQAGASSAVGVDLSAKMLEEARAQAREQGLTERTDYREGEFVELAHALALVQNEVES